MIVQWLNDDYKVMAGSIEERMEMQLKIINYIFSMSGFKPNKLGSLTQRAHQDKIILIWITPYTCLDVIDYLLNTYSKTIFEGEHFNMDEASEEAKNLTYQQLLQVVKGYFAFADSRLKKLDSSLAYPFEKISKRQLIERIGTHELERGDDLFIFHVEFIKSSEFFSFLESKYPKLLHAFLDAKNLYSWQDYVVRVTGFLSLFNEHSQVRINSGSDKDTDIQLFDNFVSSIQYLNSGSNFLNLKKYPLLKYDDSAYLMINRTFVFEKIYKTLYFEVQQIAKENSITFSKSDLGKKYFEEWLCYKYVNKIFSNKKIVNLEGTNSVFEKAKVEPDHYIRNWNDAFVFEYKDVLIRDTAKISYQEEVVLNELYDKLVEKNSGKKSAVLQLASFVLNYANDYKKFDPSAQVRRLTFYPILIVQDRCLSAPGINQVLNDWLDKYFNENAYSKPETKRLVIINIDCLVIYATFFENNPREFKKCLLEYLNLNRGLKTITNCTVLMCG